MGAKNNEKYGTRFARDSRNYSRRNRRSAIYGWRYENVHVQRTWWHAAKGLAVTTLERRQRKMAPGSFVPIIESVKTAETIPFLANRNLFQLASTCSNLLQPVPICSDSFRLALICSNSLRPTLIRSSPPLLARTLSNSLQSALIRSNVL